MQSLDSPVEHLRKCSESRDLAHWNFVLPQQFCCATGRNDLNVLTLQISRKCGNAGFVGNRNERAADFHRDARSTIAVLSRPAQTVRDLTIRVGTHKPGSAINTVVARSFALLRITVQRSRSTFFAAGYSTGQQPIVSQNALLKWLRLE